MTSHSAAMPHISHHITGSTVVGSLSARFAQTHTHTHSHRCVSVQLDWGDARYRDDVVVVVVVTAGAVAVAEHPVRNEHADVT